MTATIFYWYNGGVQQINNVANYPITFQTYINSGFIIYGVNNIQWLNTIINEHETDWFDIWNDGYNAVMFYVIPTSPNYSIAATRTITLQTL